MPELPEVETTRRGIATVMTGQPLKALNVFEPRMRWPVPADLPERVNGHRVRSCDRRGKYLLIGFDHGVMIVHLGMSGSLRRVSLDEPARKHDHIEWVFENARFLLHDPRRFGAVLWHDLADGPVLSHPLLAKLGIEPFDERFTATFLHQQLQGRTQSIKQALLGGDIVVGVGNIYASESLFRAGINPKIRAGSLSKARCERLWTSIRSTLDDALTSGGSTLRDYVNATGAPGSYFDIHAAVYDRAGQPCRVCQTPIKRIVQGQRATYYCPTCQRR
ncbi:bifunctional DNA-formamidopyrimidine glycosylase/DNA-(apurinic or apyrimidinic site) lyase [Neopusillimonas aromaticivorans]|jgi:formamidopyrimidine-DNA glycosylase|uniref:bifunctional DNA-formamidopyrimidine glycosylase/DNA-(apurinic or apyrimidinic site) lyase n=1 Tax=Neopusillimonas aromaticivorans TaxID=2979868 RepID=UPI002595FC2E|nr:bifunctional DNA-formamidopyrimidine glycosylase/DNA-(apurinic or apyrimidinic site) lyase [Neopusillimonas aromaticivorans]NLZ11613.1 bifunctional DNA-formamidopyrimidine glycosylase/DNA-(apurinic or apyrimidinic site) lyase [Alcaligenaceae bacterium]WJJ94205.1 bifunctional DNA-formamidopyrimidine glycosylase/DNA-(apurinic or apyrimidinic site) lyase [Neopusillimonas aromaticivorans]